MKGGKLFVHFSYLISFPGGEVPAGLGMTGQQARMTGSGREGCDRKPRRGDEAEGQKTRQQAQEQ